MNKGNFTAIMISGMMMFAGDDAMSQERERSKIDEEYRWNLTDLYASDEVWAQAKDAIEPKLKRRP